MFGKVAVAALPIVLLATQIWAGTLKGLGIAMGLPYAAVIGG